MLEEFTDILTIKIHDNLVAVLPHSLEFDFKISPEAQLGTLVGILDFFVNSYPDDQQNQVEEWLMLNFERSRDERHNFITRETNE